MNTDQWSLTVGVASLALATLVVVVPALRRQFWAVAGRISLAFGSDLRRYRAWFAQEHGTLRNVYLDRQETLSLKDTYVPLAGYRGDTTDRVSAADVLRDTELSQIVVLGDPGSGKSTLLRAFGSSLVRRGRVKRDAGSSLPDGHTPVFVSLRGFARYVDGGLGRTLAGYLEDEVLRRSAGIPRAESLLRDLLADGKLVLLLDGLDEVPDALAGRVRAEVLDFVKDRYLRVVLTCRRQNFLAVRTHWVPVLTDHTYTLAPLQDDEIRAFISRRARDFRPPRTPSDLFASIVSSGTLEMHRAPLILTVSIGLYLHLTGYRIPTSLTAFYQEMIKQLLTRHDFRLEVAGAVNEFAGDDKLRFLREFAHAAAIRSGQFADFSTAELVKKADALVDRLPSVHRGQSEQLVNEIVNRSGLLAQASAESDFVFAHRSIQEFLIASRLLGDPQAGADFLLTKAQDAEWRLVCIFFASFEHDYVEDFLHRLHTRNLELAGHCLAVAHVADRGLASAIVGELARTALLLDQDGTATKMDSRPAFAALVMLANSAQPWLRNMAVSALLEIFGAGGKSLPLEEFLELDQSSTARLINGLAGHGPSALPIVARLAALPAADNVRNIGPLWSSFWAADASPSQRSSTLLPIAHRLLQLAGTADGLRELQSRPAPTVRPELATVEQAYPFAHGLPPQSNLPLLLAKLHRLRLTPSGLNPLADAVAKRDPTLTTLERDQRKRSVHVELYWPARVLILGAYAVALYAIARWVTADGWAALRPDNVWAALLTHIAPGAAAVLLALFFAGRAVRARNLSERPGLMCLVPYPQKSWDYLAPPTLTERTRPREQLHAATTANPVARAIDRFTHGLLDDGDPSWDGDMATYTFLGTIVTLPLTLALANVVYPHLIVHTLVATAVCYVVFWMPATFLAAKGVRVYLRKRHPLVHIYTDPACQHWVVRDAAEVRHA